MQNSYSKEEVVYAGFWVRLAAYLMDSVIVLVPLLAVRLSAAGLMHVMEGTPLAGNLLFHYTWKDLLLYAVQAAYFILFTYNTGTTPGKRLFNLRVTGAGGEAPRFFDILYRETVGRFLCGVILYVGYIMAGIDSQKRGLHDVLCDTRVVYGKRVKVYPVYQETAYADRETPRPGAPSPQDMKGPYRMVRPEEQQERDVKS